MKTTELVDIQQALQLIEHVLLRCGEEGEYLVPRAAEGLQSDRSLAQQRLATRKSLLAAKGLLGVAAALMDEPDPRSGKEATLQIKAAIEKLKLSARGAYEAGHMLVGVKRESA